MEVRLKDNVSFKYIGYSGHAKFAINTNSYFNKNICSFIFCMSLDDLKDLQTQFLKYINDEISFLSLIYHIEIQFATKSKSSKNLHIVKCNLHIKSTRHGVIFSINNIWDCLFKLGLDDNNIKDLYSFIKNIRISIYESTKNSNELEL